MDYRYSKFELGRPLIAAAILLVMLASTVVLRGGGYGIGGLTWDNDLTITRSSLRLGGTTVLPGDRIRYVYLDGRREVHRDADLRGALRAVEEDQVFIELARPHWEIAVPLTPEAIAQDDLPAALRGPFQVVAVDGRRITGVLDVPAMADWMEMNGGQPAIFTVSVPEEPIVGLAHRVKRPSPILPVVILVLALGAVVLAHIRARSEVMSRLRRRWNLLGLTLASGGTLLAFLAWHDGFLADPYLVPFALVALVLWRPLCLFLHQATGWEVLGPSARFARLGAAIPPVVLLLASFYGWIRTMPGLWGARLDGFVLDQLRELILLGAVLTVLYHLVDIGLHGAQLKRIPREDAIRQAPSWVGTIVSSLFLVTACVALSSDPAQFAAGGWVPHLAGLVAVQWVGDMATLPIRSEATGFVASVGARPDLAARLQHAAHTLELTDPQYAVRFPGVSVVLRLAGAAEMEGRPSGAPHRLVPEALDERLAGLLELLDAEGGMFPRHKTIKGADEVGEDPFEGLDRAVGVELVLPLKPSTPMETADGMQVYLVSRREPHADKVLVPPSPEALETWQQGFFDNREVWSLLKAAAAQGALTLMARTGAGGIRADQSPDADATLPGPPSRTVSRPPVTALAQAGQAVSATLSDGASIAHGASSATYLALLHDRQATIASHYPIDEPDIVSAERHKQLEAYSRGSLLLFLGEYGSGREFCARLVHKLSRASGECVLLDCSLVPQTLVMAELTGEGDCPGRLALARRGTVIIRNLSLLERDLGGRVLNAVEEASARPIVVERQVERGTGGGLPPSLRRAGKDAVMVLPPLRERPEDIERAARFYLHRWAMGLGHVVTEFSAEALEWLKQQEWPSNYHSLIACLRDAVARTAGPTIELSHLCVGGGAAMVAEDYESRLEEVERSALVEALERAQGNKSQAARLLGIKRTTFIRKLSKYNLEE